MAYRKIHSKGDWRGEELIAGAAVTPGHLCEQYSATQVRVHSTEGGRAEKMFAYEDQLQGKTVSDAYAALDQVFLMLPAKGAEICILLAVGQTIDRAGRELVSAGDGTLKLRGTGSSGVTEWETIAYSVEAKDNSVGAAAALMRARVA